MKPGQVDKRERNNDRFKVLVKSESHCSGGGGEGGVSRLTTHVQMSSQLYLLVSEINSYFLAEKCHQCFTSMDSRDANKCK